MTLLIGARLFVQQITDRAEKTSCVEVFFFFFPKRPAIYLYYCQMQWHTAKIACNGCCLLTAFFAHQFFIGRVQNMKIWTGETPLKRTALRFSWRLSFKIIHWYSNYSLFIWLMSLLLVSCAKDSGSSTAY